MSTTSTAGAYFSWKYWSRKTTKLESNAQEKKIVNPKTNQPILKEAQNMSQKAIVDGNRKETKGSQICQSTKKETKIQNTKVKQIYKGRNRVNTRTLFISCLR